MPPPAPQVPAGAPEAWPPNGGDSLEQRVLELTAELARCRQEAELREAYLRSVVGCMPAAVAAIRASDLTYTMANELYQRLHQNRALVGLRVYHAHADADGQAYLAKLTDVVTTGQAFVASEVAWMRDRTGNGVVEECFFNLAYEPVVDSAGTVVEVLVFCVDVTTQVLARREAERREDMFRTLAETLPQIVWRSAIDGSASYFSPQWYAFTGIVSDDPAAVVWQSFVHPDDLPVINQAFLESSAAGCDFVAEYRLKRADGSYRWHLGRSVVVKGKDGRPAHRIGTATDIDEQKAAQRVVLDLKRRTEALIQDASVLLWAVDQDGVFTDYDGVVSITLGIKREERIGRNILDLYKDYPPVSDSVRRALAGETVHAESQIGDVFLDNKFTPQRDASGVVTGVIGLSIDITHSKRIEKELAAAALTARIALESSKVKSEFLANMSHEIRTPINGIMGMSGLLMDTDLATEQRDYVDAIQRSGECLLDLVNDILDLSKLDAGRLEFEDQPFVLAVVFSDLAKTLGLSAVKKGLRLEVSLSDDLPVRVSGDKGRLTQILTNLISNAIKFTDNGAILVRVLPDPGSLNERVIRVEVVDSGIGIAAETIPLLFHAFTQADASTARRYGGTGLGLSISKALVERMGGAIGVTSREGLGSTFWFTCKFNPAMQTEGEEPKQARPALERRYAGRILVAEDNVINQVIAVKLLQKFGFQVDVAANGEEAVQALGAVSYVSISPSTHGIAAEFAGC